MGNENRGGNPDAYERIEGGFLLSNLDISALEAKIRTCESHCGSKGWVDLKALQNEFPALCLANLENSKLGRLFKHNFFKSPDDT